MMTQVSAPTPTKDPLTTQDRQIIATIVNQSDYSKNCQPEDVVTIWINSDDIVWVKMTHGYARYHKELTYVGKTDIQTAHNMYNDGEFLGILFKVRNAQELWENDPKTYYWRCGDGVKYWSVRDAVVALSKITAVEEVPGVSRELIAA